MEYVYDIILLLPVLLHLRAFLCSTYSDCSVFLWYMSEEICLLAASTMHL